MADLNEPEVENVPLPNREPLCRVGIVLREDSKSKMVLELPAGRFKLEEGETSFLLDSQSAVDLIFEAQGNEIVCFESDGAAPIHSGDTLSIEPLKVQETLLPKGGMLLKGVVAGRGFHWQKEVDLTYPGRLEFFAREGNLIVVNVLPMEAYLACVVTSEMSGACPAEFLKAQATAARSWMMVFLKNKHTGEPFSICNDDCCQRYQGTTFLSDHVAGAVERSRGMFIVTEEGYLCAAYYSKSCGGIMERAQNIFGEGAVGISEKPDAPDGSITSDFNPVTEENIREWVTGKFLKKSDSFCSPNVCPEETLPKYLGAVDEAGKYYRWRVEYARQELEDILRQKAGVADMAEFVDVHPIQRGNSGRLHELGIIYRDGGANLKTLTVKSQYEIRRVLHEKFLFSSAFVWDFERDADGRINKIALRGAGWGHGVGLCQIGALGMSLQGHSYEDIIKHYYSGCTLVRAYE